MNTTGLVTTVTDELLREFDSIAEYDDDDNKPVAELRSVVGRITAELRRLRAENAELAKDAGRYRAWESIIDEVERRAGKECCIEHGCDFTVTVMHDDYVNALVTQ